MNSIRYIMTGGDNGYCARCGGLGDRALLRVDDKKKTYKTFYRAPSCLGKHCWRKEELYGGRAIARGVINNGKLVYNFLEPQKNKVYIVETNGTELEFTPVIVKNNKYGKDGEFGDKLDEYKYEGSIEPQELIEQWRQEQLEATKKYYEEAKIRKQQK